MCAYAPCHEDVRKSAGKATRIFKPRHLMW